jgi:hypothetical protein
MRAVLITPDGPDVFPSLSPSVAGGKIRLRTEMTTVLVGMVPSIRS